MRVFSCGLGIAALLASTSWATAAPATLEEARTIKSALERYLGHGPEGAETVAVAPAGEGYTIGIDLKTMLQPLSAFGITVDAATYSFTATPQDDGLWRVTSAGVPRIHANRGDRSYNVVVNGMQADGLFDPRIPSYVSSNASYDSASVAALGGPDGTQTREQIGGRQSFVAKPAARDGSIDAVLTGSLARSTQDITLDMPAAGTAGAGSRLSVRSGATSQTIRIDALQIRALTDLWAFFVAHSSPDQSKAAQEELRGLLRSALPLFAHMAQDGTIASLAADSPYGAFAVQSVSGGIALNGLTQDGLVQTHLKVDGLSIPANLIPAWAAGLVPTGFEIGESVTGFHLDSAAATAVAALDLQKPDFYAPEDIERMRAALGPLEQVRLSLAPSRLTSSLLDVAFSGDLRFAQPVPDVHIVIKAKGFDTAVKSIQAAANGDPTATQVVAVLLLAKGYGTAEPDGTMSWTLANSPAGDITVNGIALPFGKQ